MLRRDDLVAPSVQDGNAGNSGDLVKHTCYLALIRELTRQQSTRPTHIVECHGGKGVYVSAHRHLMAARGSAHYRTSSLGMAQDSCFDPETGLGPIVELKPRELAYAGSAALHAELVRRHLETSLTVFDSDPGVRKVAEHVFSQPCFSPARSRLLVENPEGPSEAKILHHLSADAFSASHILHFDPFAFVMAKDHLVTRSLYRDLVQECDSRIRDGHLGSASVFFTWGSNGAAAKDDLEGDGYLGGLVGGYQDLVSSVSPAQRVVVTWCWELFFAFLLIVPASLRPAAVQGIKSELAWLRPFTRYLNVS